MDINKISCETLRCEYLNGAYNDFANLLGIDAVLKIHSMYRGQQITFPVELFSKEFIAKQIVCEYDGYNIKQLATKFGYSEKCDYYGAAEPPVRCGVSHLSELTEPLLEIAI